MASGVIKKDITVISINLKKGTGASVEDVAAIPSGYTKDNCAIDTVYYAYGHAYPIVALRNDMKCMPILSATNIQMQYLDEYSNTRDIPVKIILRKI
jgi:hypothetical protein